MLSLSERHRVFIFLRCMCIANVFPVKAYDGRAWGISPEVNSEWKARAAKASYFLFVAHTLFKVGRLVQTVFFFPHQVPFYQMLIHGLIATGAVMLAFWYYTMFVKHADVYTRFVNMTLTGNITGGK